MIKVYIPKNAANIHIISKQ